MYKIRKLKFINHPVLNNLELDFCNSEGHAVDTVIFAGENGTGKSTILNAIYSIVTQKVNFEAIVEYEIDKSVRTLEYKYKTNTVDGKDYLHVSDGKGLNSYILSPDVANKYPMSAIFSDVDIIFQSDQIRNVTSLSLDEHGNSRRSSANLSVQIKQLLIDIQALDDAEVAYAVRSNPELKGSQMHLNVRMSRFTDAFNRMFDELSYNRIENKNDHKTVLFSKNGVVIPIDSLSSGEKQIVYRGCFLLKDINALSGAFVLIDEPEISLHPKWQNKIMDYYKSIFTDNMGNQTSQIFAVTHSPFIIHNENRRNDKVIVLNRDNSGDIKANDKPEYYKCNSIEVISDAFSISNFSKDKSTVYLEGRTDEKYFNKTLEVFGITAPFQFKWIGYIDSKGNDANSGKDALNQAFNFLVSSNLPIKNVCLFDSDTKRDECEKNNVFIRTIPSYTNSKQIMVGIENALVLDSIDTTSFYTITERTSSYGEKSKISHFDKMKFCDYICSLDNKKLKVILKNLFDVIKSLINLYDKETTKN